MKYWLPALVSGGIAWTLYLLADTPVVRAAGLALVIVGVALALRRMGSALAVIGSLTLALCPAFWSQTGGGEGTPATIVIAIGTALVAVTFTLLISRRPYIGFGLGVAVFALLFWSQIGTPRSIRLTGFVVGWLMYLLIDMLLLTNPRPEDTAPPPLLRLKTPAEGDNFQAQPYHTLGILLLFGIGALNDPLLTLLAPAIFLSLWLSNAKVPVWYWIVLSFVVGAGARGISVDYLQNQSHWIALMAWRDANRWIDLVNLVVSQFTIFGVLLGVLGLARLSRWYPPLGVVTMTGYAAYVFFGLVYSGPNRPVLLLPLLIIQITWMTYAVFTLGEWLKKSFPARAWLLRYGILVLYGLLPLTLLWNRL